MRQTLASVTPDISARRDTHTDHDKAEQASTIGQPQREGMKKHGWCHEYQVINVYPHTIW